MLQRVDYPLQLLIALILWKDHIAPRRVCASGEIRRGPAVGVDEELPLRGVVEEALHLACAVDHPRVVEIDPPKGRLGRKAKVGVRIEEVALKLGRQCLLKGEWPSLLPALCPVRLPPASP